MDNGVDQHDEDQGVVAHDRRSLAVGGGFREKTASGEGAATLIAGRVRQGTIRPDV